MFLPIVIHSPLIIHHGYHGTLGRDRIARCAKMVDDNVHQTLTSEAGLFLCKEELGTSNSICDTNGFTCF
jgi:hypothetical protein